MSFGSVQHYPVRVNLINEKQIDAYVALAIGDGFIFRQRITIPSPIPLHAEAFGESRCKFFLH